MLGDRWGPPWLLFSIIIGVRVGSLPAHSVQGFLIFQWDWRWDWMGLAWFRLGHENCEIAVSPRQSHQKHDGIGMGLARDWDGIGKGPPRILMVLHRESVGLRRISDGIGWDWSCEGKWDVLSTTSWHLPPIPS